MATQKIANTNIYADSYVAKDWGTGYKVELHLTSESVANDWMLDLNLPTSYNIREVYGVELTNNGNGNSSISGQGSTEDLDPGETAKAVFIIDSYGQDAILPQFNYSNYQTTTPEPELTSDSPEVEQPVVETASTDNTLMGSVISDPIPVSQPSQLSSNAISVGFENHANGTTYGTVTQREDWKSLWSVQMNEGELASISNQEAHSGNNSLKIDYPANAQSNVGAQWQIPPQQEYYLSYWVKFDGNFDFDGARHSGGKLPGLGSGDLASGGNKPNGNNGFTSRYMWRENGKAVLYLYHMDQPDIWGEDISLTGADGSDKYFERGKWHNMIQRVKVNNGGQSNGEIDVWMDNEQVLDLDGLRFTNGQGIDTTYFSTFHGGSGSDWWPEYDVNAYFDDFVVSTNAADVGL